MINSKKTTVCLVLFFSFFLLLSSFTTAKTGLSLTTPRPFSNTEDQYVEQGVSLVTPPEENLNITVNLSVTEADTAGETDVWVTNEGDIQNVDDILHNDLGGLQGGASGEYYHLDEGDYNYLHSNLNDFITSDSDTTYSFNNTQMSNSGNFISILDSWVLNLVNNAYLNFSGSYDWVAESPWLEFNGTYLSYNESKLREETEITLQQETTTITVAGGTGSATTANVIDFEIKEIDVECSSGTKFRFEASETTSGSIIDKNRKQHSTDWRVEKNYPINDTVDLLITNASPANDMCNATIKYLDNFQ